MKITYLSYALLLVGLLTQCSKSELSPGNEHQEPLEVSFLGESLQSSNDSISVSVHISQVAANHGSIYVSLRGDVVYEEDFITIPAMIDGFMKIELLSGTKTAEMKIVRLKNHESTKSIHLELSNPSTGFKLGEIAVSNLKIHHAVTTKNQVNFERAETQLFDNQSEGVDLELDLVHKTSKTEQMSIAIVNSEDFKYGKHFLTSPAAVLNELSLVIDPGVNKISFKIIPMVGKVAVGTKEIRFNINAVSDLEKGILSETVVKIFDGDFQPATFGLVSDLRSSFSTHEEEWWVSDDYYIQGVVSSAGNTFNNKSYYIQDGTGGVLFQFSTPQKLVLGDKVRVNLKGSTGLIINGQKAFKDVLGILGKKQAENQFVAPEVITLEQLKTGAFEGRRVRINNVKFPLGNGVRTFAGNQAITSGSVNGIVTTHAGASFNNVKLPEGTVSIIGIVGDNGHILPQDIQSDIIL